MGNLSVYTTKFRLVSNQIFVFLMCLFTSLNLVGQVSASTMEIPAFFKVNSSSKTSYLLDFYEKSFSYGLVDKTLKNLMFIAPKELSDDDAVRFHMLLGLVFIESGGFRGEQEITNLEKLKAGKNILNMMRGAAACKNKAYEDAMFFLEKVDILDPYMQRFTSYIQYKRGMCCRDDKTRSAGYLLKALSAKAVFAPVYLELGKVFLAERKYRETVNVLRKYNFLISDDFDVVMLLGKLYLQQRQPREAAAFFAKARAMRPMDSKAALNLLNSLLVDRDFEELVSSGLKIIDDMPFLRDAFYLVFEGYVGLDKLEDAISLLEKIPVHESFSPLLLGIAHLAGDDISSAEKSLSSPDGVGVLFPIARAVLMLKQGKLNEGKAVLTEFLQKKNTGNDKMHGLLKKSTMFFLGLFEAASGNYDMAEADWKKADSFLSNFYVKNLKLRPYFERMSKYDLALLGVGTLLFSKGWDETALRYFERGGGNNFFSCFVMGSIYLKKRDFANAKKYFLLSNSAEKEFTGSMNSLAKIFSTQKKYIDAILWYKKALTLDSGNSKAIFSLGLLYDLREDYDESIKLYKRFLELNPKSYIACNQIAWNLGVRKNRLEKALEYALMGMELKANNGSLLDTTGWIYFLLGNYEKAHEFLLRARNIGMRSPTYYYHFAAVKVKLGETRAAHKILKSISNKTFTEEEEANELLRHIEIDSGNVKAVD